jgi:uroporphyrinogen-III synthase
VAKRIFISKNASEIEPYREQLEAKGYEIIAHSFLSFSPVEFELQNEYDVIFFGSPRAVIFFKAGQSISSKARIACVGSKTAEVVQSMGHTVDFVGTKSSEPKLVAEEFKSWLAERSRSQHDARVLFPISDRSLKTISSVIDDDHKEEVVVYSTEVKGQVIPPCDVYVFSSPSNVEGLFMENALPDECKVIAWGTSTESALGERGASVERIFSVTSLEGLTSSL